VRRQPLYAQIGVAERRQPSRANFLKPSRFIYHAPRSIDEAVRLLNENDGSARILAGGQSLIPMMNFRMAAPAALVDLGKIQDLAYIRDNGGAVRIGAMTRQRSIEFSPLVREKLPLLREAIGWVGHLPTRSRGTVGGSIAHADPSTEIPMVLQALEGEITTRGPNGERTIKAEDLFVGPLTTALEPNEILTEIRFPVMPADAGYAFEEFARRHGDFAIVAIAAAIRINDGAPPWVRLAAAGTGPTPLKLNAAAAILLNRGLDAAAIDEASDAAGEELVEPTSDNNGSGEFRRHLTKVLTGRAIRRAVAMAMEKAH
jgi:aerobic carbon-monoxide dehydrogenase medium subunit